MNAPGKITISVCGTHHVDYSEPLYYDKFDEVLAYHEVDGQRFAPVSLNGRAWHIGLDGKPAYAMQFDRTFGFYCNYAAVIQTGEWFHIRSDGSPLYPERYSFTGNYQQEIAVVCDHDGHYFHIDNQGKPLYQARWCYCGDFREGIAVVQADTGLSTHIFIDGSMSHGQWFSDLDVFHKGYARAKDIQGWHHIDREGAPVYTDRYVSAEPFYNGYARCETKDGALVIINESGKNIRQLRAPTADPFAALSADMVGYWRTFTIATSVELGVFDYLPAKASELAQRISCPLERVNRLLNALSELGLVETSDVGWDSTPKGEFLRSNHPKTLTAAAAEYAGNLLERWKRLPEIVRGYYSDDDIFKSVAADSSRVLSHHQMLRSYALHDYEALTDKFFISPGDTVLDAGGGSGTLATLLQQANPEVNVFLADLPEVVVVADFQQVIAFDFFNPWPMSADKILLSRVLHDWADDNVELLLRNAVEALNNGGRLYIIEMLLDETSTSGSLCDLHLLAVTGGKERTMSQFIRLARNTGLELDSEYSSGGIVSVLCFMKENDK